MDIEMEYLGVELLDAFKDGYFDPDAHFTPVESYIRKLATMFGFDYHEIRAESNERIKERKERIEARLRELGEIE